MERAKQQATEAADTAAAQFSSGALLGSLARDGRRRCLDLVGDRGSGCWRYPGLARGDAGAPLQAWRREVHLKLLFGNSTRSGSAFIRASISLIKRVLVRPASFGGTR